MTWEEVLCDAVKKRKLHRKRVEFVKAEFGAPSREYADQAQTVRYWEDKVRRLISENVEWVLEKLKVV